MSGIVTLPGGPYLASGRPNTKRSNPKAVADLAQPLQERVAALIADCPWPGELWLNSGLRDPGRQWDLRDARVGRKSIWVSPPTGNPVTAVPARWDTKRGVWVGGSRHQHGSAADLDGTPRARAWARANREAYGLALTVRSEDWHYEPDRRDVRTGRVHNNPVALAKQPTPPPTPPAPPTGALTMADITTILAKLDEIDAKAQQSREWSLLALAEAKKTNEGIQKLLELGLIGIAEGRTQSAEDAKRAAEVKAAIAALAPARKVADILNGDDDSEVAG